MKQTILTLVFIAGILHAAFAQLLDDSLQTEPIAIHHHLFNVVFTYTELGMSIPIKEKHIQALPHGMNDFLYHLKNTSSIGFFGIGLYYKNRLGFSVILSEIKQATDNNAFRNYLTTQFPNHYVQIGKNGHNFSLSNLSYRLGYRFHKGKYQIEPQFQIGKNNRYTSIWETHLKEKGSNQFIHYSIKGENKSKNPFMYRAGVVATRRISKPHWAWEFEPGLRFDVLLIPIEMNYTITIAPYQMPSSSEEVLVKQWYPNFMFSFVVSAHRK